MKALVEIRDVSKYFGGIKAVDGVSLSLGAGEVLGLLGANGAGKTTLIRMLCGLLKPDSGSLSINGRFGYMCQSFSLIEELTIHENIHFYGTLYKLHRSQIAVKESEMVDKLHLGPYLHKRASDLPNGWRQALSFSIAVMADPQVLVLDEPTSGLDSLSRRRMWKMMRERAAQGTAIIVSTHYLDEAFYCNRLSIMKSGQFLCEGRPEELASSNDALMKYFE